MGRASRFETAIPRNPALRGTERRNRRGERELAEAVFFGISAMKHAIALFALLTGGAVGGVVLWTSLF